MVEKSYLLKSQPMFFVASHTEWREPSDFQPEFPVFHLISKNSRCLER